MTDEEFQKEVDDLVAMLNDFRLIRDTGRRKWLSREIRAMMTRLLRN